MPYLSNLSSQCSIPLLDLTETCLQYQFLNPAQYLGEVFAVLFDFSLCSLESIPTGFDFIGLEMGTTSSTDFKVPEKILVYNQCSQLRTSAESNGNLASLKDTTTPSNRGLFPLPDTLKCGYSLLFITTHLPLILMVPMTQF